MKNHAFRRTRERQEIRLRILDATRELFVARGGAAVTLREVARMIEYSATTIYLYFPDKRALLAELCTLDFAAHSSAFKQAERSSSTRQRLRQTLVAYVDFGIEHPHHYSTMFISVGEPPDKDTRPGQSAKIMQDRVAGRKDVGHRARGQASIPSPSAYDYLYAAVFQALAAGSLCPDLIDAHQVTQTLWGGVHGIVCLSFVRVAHAEVPWRPPESNANAAINCLLRGVLRDP